MSQPDASVDEPSKAKEGPDHQRKIPIARPINSISGEKFWNVFWDTFEGE